MLTQLLIRDLAIVSSVELEFAAGMSALTGETGAGKSIMIDALGLALGDKADGGLVRPGCERAEIIASFALDACPGARAWLAEQALDEGDECILRRVIPREGRSRAYINGRTANSAQLRELANHLVDIHGQHAHQSLLRPAMQRELLDAYGGQGELAAQVAEAFRHYRTLDQELGERERTERARLERLDLLQVQVEELDALALTLDELQTLDQEQRRLSHLGRLQEGAAALLLLLAEGEPALADQLHKAEAELAELAAIDPALTEGHELLASAAIHASEAASSLRHYLDGLDLDPEALERVETRLAQIHALARRYRVFPEQLPELLDERRAELAHLEQAGTRLAELRTERERAWSRFLDLAGRLSAARRETAEQLSATVTQAMQQLAMAGGRFAVTLEALDPEHASAAGLERIDFLVSANPGQPLQALARVASGGELSRISLAIQVATAECASVPTLVFDEVDVGIGGGVAEIVGRLLRQLGARRQVLCVTHLPQVAAQAHRQLRVRKETLDGQTHTRIEPLDAEARVEEIARMLGGTRITSRTRDHAREMLSLPQDAPTDS